MRTFSRFGLGAILLSGSWLACAGGIVAVTEGQSAPWLVTVRAEAAAGSDIVRYDWLISDGQTQTSLLGTDGVWRDSSGTVVGDPGQARFLLNAAGNYRLTLRVTDRQGAESVFSDSLLITEPATDAPVAVVNQPPTAEFTLDPLVGPAPLTVNLDAAASRDDDGQIRQYFWEVTDGTEVLCANDACSQAQVILADPAAYGITLTVIDDQGERGRLTRLARAEAESETLQPHLPPVPVVDITQQATEAGQPARFTLSAARSTTFDDATITEYRWRMPNGTERLGQEISLTLSAPGSHAVDLIVTDDQEGVASLTSYVSLPVSATQTAQAPIAIFSMTPAGGYTPVVVAVDASGSVDPDGEIVSYAWQTLDGQTGEGPRFRFLFQQPPDDQTIGTGKIQLTVTDNEGLEGVLIQDVPLRVRDAPNQPPVVSLTITPREGVAPLTVHFDGRASHDPDGSVAEFSWVVAGEIHERFARDWEHTFEQAGEYSVFLQIRDEAGVYAMATDTVVVSPDPSQPDDPIPDDSTDPTPVAPGMPPIPRPILTPERADAPVIVVADASQSLAAGEIVAYRWIVSDGRESHVAQAEFGFPDPGHYNLTLEIIDDQGLRATRAAELWITAPLEETLEPDITTPPDVDLTPEPDPVHGLSWNLLPHYAPGERVHLIATEDATRQKTADLWLATRLANGQILVLGGPLIANLPPTTTQHTLLDFIASPDIAGEYQLLAALVSPGEDPLRAGTSVLQSNLLQGVVKLLVE